MRNLGKFLILFSLVIWIIDRLTSLFSTFIGKMICGDKYLCAVDGVVGDCSCGFNTDMHLSLILITLMTLGVVLFFKSEAKKDMFPVNIKNAEANG
jgi:hypothetical protein